MTDRIAPLSGCSASPAVLTEVVGLLDEAHRELETRDLAALLLEFRELAAPLARGRLPRRPGGGSPAAVHPRLGPAARVYDRALRAALWDCVTLNPRTDLAETGDWLTRHLEDLAVRPRGCALPAV